MIKYYLKLHSIIILLGFTAILGQLISCSPVLIVLFRSLIATIGLFFLIKLKQKIVKIEAKSILVLMSVGFLLGFHWLCFFGSARLSTVSISLVAYSTTSFFSCLLEPLIKKTSIKWVEVSFGSVAIIGIGLIFNFEFKYFSGIALGLVGAFLAALFSIFNSTLTHKHDSLVISFYELFGSFFAVLILLPLFSYYKFINWSDLLISEQDWVWLSILGIICTVIPYVEMLKLLKHISVFSANLSLNMEPIYGVILAFVFFGGKEKMSYGFYLGGILVILSVFLQPLVNVNKKAFSKF